ncbi:MAG TPA: DNA-directed RNA polymerase subunit beta', partial [Actinomycetota bacterium]|nr:DNA-directed RNA polymerase subunit beta' [Actinomycetota bacterium]
MAVHLPLSAEAQAEARVLMLSANNILSPASGRPLATPTQDMVLGAYFLTYSSHDLDSMAAADLSKELGKNGLPRFRTEEDVEFAVEAEQVGYQDPIEYEWGGERLLTTPGRVIFNAEVERALDEATGGDFEDHPYLNRTLTKIELDSFIGDLVERYGPNTIAAALDIIKSVTFRFATRAGITISKNDIVIPDEKESLLAGFEDQVATVGKEYDRGLMTEEERHERIVAIWTEATNEVANAMMANLSPTNPIYMMANSGARGSFSQIRQLAGMRGLMADPKGEIIARPIKANFMEGLSVLEYFISTHGARKGLADTALRTADSGYLTRRLVDVSQDVIVRDADCGTDEFVDLPLFHDRSPNKSLAGRVAAADIHKPIKDGKPGRTVLVEKGAEVTPSVLRNLVEEFGEYAETSTVSVRSVLKCRSEFGVCRLCYGTFLATGGLTEIGDAIGIIAAQSIGEPGTQLTMRTFHTGGVSLAGGDITQGLPRVVEIFEARNPKGAAVLADVAGKIDIDEADRTIKVTVTPTGLDDKGELPDPKEYSFPRRTRLRVTKGELVEPGDALNEGSINPGELLTLKGATATELYLVDEVQKFYKSQGVEIHDK